MADPLNNLLAQAHRLTGQLQTLEFGIAQGPQIIGQITNAAVIKSKSGIPGLLRIAKMGAGNRIAQKGGLEQFNPLALTRPDARLTILLIVVENVLRLEVGITQPIAIAKYPVAIPCLLYTSRCV